ncbi:MAG: 2-amino-4-hydroxy-6-hydroxymethyldihydropteridine diphosphokinase [Bacteroidales bacterium]|nr:2-amino-4-hydroxy-6-hydroxymethyldihydropteridine diphosphokinase [Bacteroidales bacterium]
MNTVYLLLGGNTGLVLEHFTQAIGEINKRVGTVTAQSPIYESEAWGFSSELKFFNQVIVVDTLLDENQVLKDILDIERMLGRIRNNCSEGYQSRPIDIDILFYNNLICNCPDLTLPHPRLHLRRFTLSPLNDIAPQLVHPVLNKTIHELFESCPDYSDVVLINELK